MADEKMENQTMHEENTSGDIDTHAQTGADSPYVFIENTKKDPKVHSSPPSPEGKVDAEVSGGGGSSVQGDAGENDENNTNTFLMNDAQKEESAEKKKESGPVAFDPVTYWGFVNPVDERSDPYSYLVDKDGNPVFKGFQTKFQKNFDKSLTEGVPGKPTLKIANPLLLLLMKLLAMIGLMDSYVGENVKAKLDETAKKEFEEDKKSMEANYGFPLLFEEEQLELIKEQMALQKDKLITYTSGDREFFIRPADVTNELENGLVFSQIGIDTGEVDENGQPRIMWTKLSDVAEATKEQLMAMHAAGQMEFPDDLKTGVAGRVDENGVYRVAA